MPLDRRAEQQDPEDHRDPEDDPRRRSAARAAGGSSSCLTRDRARDRAHRAATSRSRPARSSAGSSVAKLVDRPAAVEPPVDLAGDAARRAGTRTRSAVAAADGVVGDHHDRVALAAVEVAAASSRISALAARVEVAGRLVGEHELGLRAAARGRSTPAAARRPTAPPGSVGRRGRRGRRGRAARARACARRPSSVRRAISAGSRTFSSAVSEPSRLKNWKTKPMWSRRSRVRALSSSAVVALAGDRDRSPAVGRLERAHAGAAACSCRSPTAP